MPEKKVEEIKEPPKSVERNSISSKVLSQSDMMEDEENAFMPNAFLEHDPKPVLSMLAEYS